MSSQNSFKVALTLPLLSNRFITKLSLMLLVLFTMVLLPATWNHATAQSVTRGPSGLPLPRFVSLKSGRVNLRVGPGRDYAVEWMYLKPGLPMEIVQEYDNWRRVRDWEGTEGWIYGSLLSGRRTAVVAPWKRRRSTLISLHSQPSDGASSVAEMEPGVIGTLDKCDGNWCEMSVGRHRGWINQSLLWGAYPNEEIND